MSLWSVYMLRCGDGSLYTGCTNDLDGRVKRHQTGKGARYTRSRRPVKLVWHEPADDKSAALKREAALKKLSREEKLLLVGTRIRLKVASRAKKVRRALRAPSK